MRLKYFGTDGIRGAVGGPFINAAFAQRFGHALATFLVRNNPNKPITVVIGRDPRESGVELEAAISESLCGSGVHLMFLGVIPTPGVALAVKQLHADMGIALTASHNPHTDNGIKLFDNCGHKLLQAAEAEIEQLIDAVTPAQLEQADTCGYNYDGRDHYVNFARSLLDYDCLKGSTIALDCSHGATAKTSPEVLRHFGAELVLRGCEPNGHNINDGVGSECPEGLADLVRQSKARLGIAHDGDGDRCVLVDELGNIVDGDRLMGILALHLLRTGKLAKKTLVTTVQSNLGLDRTLTEAGGKVIRVDVGDRNVLHGMLSGGYNFGGEQSGHYIFGEHLFAGDGLLAAIKTIEVMLARGKTLSELGKDITLFPLLKKNVRVQEKIPLERCPNLRAFIKQAEADFDGQGRLLVRYSGTEPKLRFLVEAYDEDTLPGIMQQLIQAASQDLEIEP